MPILFAGRSYTSERELTWKKQVWCAPSAEQNLRDNWLWFSTCKIMDASCSSLTFIGFWNIHRYKNHTRCRLPRSLLQLYLLSGPVFKSRWKRRTVNRYKKTRVKLLIIVDMQFYPVNCRLYWICPICDRHTTLGQSRQGFNSFERHWCSKFRVSLKKLTLQSHFLFTSWSILQVLCCTNSGHTIRFTLWNQDAHAFRQTEYEKAEKPVIIAVSSCLVKNYGGKPIY